MQFLRLCARFIAMVAVMGFFLVRYLWGRLGTLLVASGEPRRQAVAHLRGRTLRRMFEALGATFVKLGQVLSTRPDLLSAEMIDELRHLQDRLAPFPGGVARRIVEEDLARPVAAIFAEFDDQPVAAASVAQVHRGRLIDGREVAIKVLRPDVRAKVQRDAVILGVLAKILELSPKLRLSDPVGHIKEFSKGIVEQTDLRHEERNYQRFAREFANFEGVRFPTVIPELCGARVMTMEFVRGHKLDALPPGNHEKLAKRLQQVILHMCFEHGFVHADLHPGNMVVQEGTGALVIFDVGLAKELSGSVFPQFVDFSRCIAMGAPHDFVEHLKHFHTYMEGVDWARLEVDVTKFIASFRAQSTQDLEMGAMFNELYAIARRYNVRPMPEVVLVMVGMVTVEGIGKQLNPHGNTFVAVSEFLLPRLAKLQASVLASQPPRTT